MTVPTGGERVRYSRGGNAYEGTVRTGFACYDRTCKAVHVTCDNGTLHHLPRYLFAAEMSDERGWARVLVNGHVPGGKS